MIVQGRYDVATPAVTAWELHRAWPTAELQIIGDAGHAWSEPGIAAALVAATDRFADPVRPSPSPSPSPKDLGPVGGGH